MSLEYSRKPPEDEQKCGYFILYGDCSAHCSHKEGSGYCHAAYAGNKERCPLAIGTVYFASPFFNAEEETFVDLAVKELRELGFKVFSPKEEGGIIGKDAPKEAAQTIFDNNIKAIQAASIVVAVIDDFDPGTVFEIGYAFGIGKSVVTVSRQNYGLNIMLSKSCIAHFGSLQSFLASMKKYWETGNLPKNIWKGDVV